MRLLPVLLLAGLLLLVVTPTAQARHLGPPILLSLGEPVQDHYVSNGTFADTNFAQGTIHFGTGSGTRIERGFLEWDVSAVPAGATIVSASIAVHQSTTPVVGFEALFCIVTATWLEGTITFNNQPAIGACPGTYSVPTTGGLKNVTLDTSIVDAWLAGPNHGLRANMTDESSAIFGSQSHAWEGSEFSDPHPGDASPSATLFVSYTPPPTLEETAIASLLVIAAIVVALGFFILVTRKKRTLEDLFIFLTFVFVFVVGVGIAVSLFFGG